MKEEHEYAIRINKSQIKREMKLLRELGKRMRELSLVQLDTMPISEPLKQEIINGKNFKKGALRRHLIFIEKLMRSEDAEAVVVALDKIDQSHQDQVDHFHQLEQWRDKLIAGDNVLLEELLARFEMMDRQHMCQLLRNAAKEKAQNKPPKASRLLFKYLKEQE